MKNKLVLYFIILTTFITNTYAADGFELYKNKKFTEAHKLLKPIADNGNSEAQLLIGKMYLEGKGVKKDNSLAVSYLIKASDNNNGEASYLMSKHYLNEKNIELALAFLIKAFNQGNTEAEFLYAGYLKNNNNANCVDAYRRAANKEHSEAQFELAKLYEQGVLIKKDDDMAEYWLSKSIGNKNYSATIYSNKKHYEIKAEKLLQSLKENYKLGTHRDYLCNSHGSDFYSFIKRKDHDDLICRNGNLFTLYKNKDLDKYVDIIPDILDEKEYRRIGSYFGSIDGQRIEIMQKICRKKHPSSFIKLVMINWSEYVIICNDDRGYKVHFSDLNYDILSDKI